MEKLTDVSPLEKLKFDVSPLEKITIVTLLEKLTLHDENLLALDFMGREGLSRGLSSPPLK